MSLRLFYVGLVVAVLSATPLAAQNCYPPYVRIVYTAAGCTSGYCPPNAPVTFSLLNGNTNAPYVLTCETGVTWDFGDGGSGTGVSASHTYSATGSYFVIATVHSSPYGTSAYTYATIANGVVSATPSKNPVYEHDGSVSVQVHTTYSPTSVDYQVNEVYASDSRITAASGTLTFASGEYDKTITIPITDNTTYEGDANIGVSIYNPTGGVMVLPGSANQYITLREDDPPPILNLSATSYTFSEAAGNAVITVNRTGDMSRTVGVYYYVSGGTYQSGTLSFGPNVTSQTITIPIPNDSVWNPDRVWSVSIQSPYGGAVLGSAQNYQYYQTSSITIRDDEPVPALSISDALVAEGNSGRQTANLTLTLSAALSTYCTVGLTYGGSATRTIDYDATTTFVSFNAGETTKTIPITVIGDTQIEKDETVTVTIGSISTGFYYYPPLTNVPAIAKGTGTLTIANDDIGMTWIKLAAGTSGRMTIYLGNPTSAQDTITLTSSKPDIAKVPASFVAQSGRATLDFNVDALTPGTSLITAKFPASLGGDTLSANVDVYTPATLAVQPQSLSVPVNTSAALTLSMSPAPAAPVALKVTSANTTVLDVPATVTIGTNGTGTLNVKGLAVGNGAITITLPAENGGFDTMVLVTVTAPPNGVFVSQVSPPNGPTAGGTTVTITGLNFAAPCSVAFGGSAASSTAFVSANSLTATTPAHAAGPVDVAVTCGTDHFTFGNGFTYVAKASQLSSLSPVSGTSSGGTTVAISGSDLRSSCGVFFGGIAAKVVSDQTPDKLIVATPAHLPGAVDVMLQCDDSASTLSSAFAFVTGSEPAAVIADVDPLAASAGQTVTINGFRFRTSDTITFADTHAAVLNTAPGSHVVVVPAVSPGKVAITLTDSDGHSSTTGPIFSVLEPVTPEITSVTPSRVGPGGEIVITGKGFRAPYTFALGDKRAGTILDLSFNRAVVRIDPAFAPGTFTLGVINGSGVLAAVGPKIDVAAALMASSVAPVCATAAGGVDVTLTGGGFQPGAQVTIGANAATNVRVVDDHTIVATVPAGKIGWPSITITNPNGDATTLTRGFFYYSPYDRDGGCSSTRSRGVHH